MENPITSITISLVIAKNDNEPFTQKEFDSFIDKIINLIENENCYSGGQFIPNTEESSSG